MPSTALPGARLLAFPPLEIDRARERREHDELRERDARASRASAAVASNVCRPIARQPEDERAEHVDAVLAERAQAFDERVARELKSL